MATKQAPQKAPVKQKAAQADATTAEDKKAARDELAQQIVAAREAGEKWEEIANNFGTSTGRAMLLHMEATVRPKDRIKGSSDEELGAKIVTARDEDKLSWGQIMARTGLSETRCRNLYEQATGKSTRGNRIGKGGRYPDGTTPPARAADAKPKAPAKKAPAKKAPAKKAPAAKAGSAPAPVSEGSAKEVATELVGKTVTFKVGGKQQRVKVADLLDVTGTGQDREIVVADAADNEVTFTVASIVKVAAR